MSCKQSFMYPLMEIAFFSYILHDDWSCYSSVLLPIFRQSKQQLPHLSFVVSITLFTKPVPCFNAWLLWLFECVGNNSEAAGLVSRTVWWEILRISKGFPGVFKENWCVMRYGFFGHTCNWAVWYFILGLSFNCWVAGMWTRLVLILNSLFDSVDGTDTLLALCDWMCSTFQPWIMYFSCHFLVLSLHFILFPATPMGLCYSWRL